MQQLRDGEVVVEGNKVVDNIKPVENWAEEFEKPNPHAGQVWPEEFSSREEHQWANEFQGNGPDQSSWTHEFSNTYQPEKVKNMVTLPESLHSEPQIGAASAVIVEEESKEQVNKEMEDLYEQYNEDFKKDYGARISTMESEGDLQSAWAGLMNALDDPKYDTYIAVKVNPFDNQPLDSVLKSTRSSSLVESLLALEALVQKEPENCNAWLDLGT